MDIYKSNYVEVSQMDVNNTISEMEHNGWVLHSVSSIYSGPREVRKLGLVFRKYMNKE